MNNSVLNLLKRSEQVGVNFWVLGSCYGTEQSLRTQVGWAWYHHVWHDESDLTTIKRADFECGKGMPVQRVFMQEGFPCGECEWDSLRWDS